MNNKNPNIYNNSTYPQPIELDEETGKIRLQRFEENAAEQHTNPQQQDTHDFSTQQSQFQGSQSTSQNAANGMGMEKLFSMLKNGGASNDMLSALLMKNGANQNPLMSQALSKILTSSKKSNDSIKSSSQTPPTFEEM